MTLHTDGSLLESSADTTLTGGTVSFSSSGRDYGIFVYGESTLKISCMRLTIDAGMSFDNAVAGSGSSQLIILDQIFWGSEYRNGWKYDLDRNGIFDVEYSSTSLQS